MAKKPGDDLIKRISREAVERSKKAAKKRREPPQAPGELWPGESLDPDDPGRFLLARAKRRRRAVAAIRSGEVA